MGQDDIPYNLCSPRSACPQCQSPIVPWHNIPLLSYLWLRGKCAHCAQHISCRYPCVELLTGLAFLFIAYRHQGDIWTVLLLSVAWCLILALFLIDWDTQLLPDVLTLSLLWLGLIYHTHIHEQVLIHVIWGAVLGYMSLWAVYWLFRLLTGKEGMGFGDFKLLAALGAWLGWSMLPLVILLSSLFWYRGWTWCDESSNEPGLCFWSLPDSCGSCCLVLGRSFDVMVLAVVCLSSYESV